MSYYAAVDDIAAKLAPIKGNFCKDPGDIPTWVAPADLCGDHGLDPSGLGVGTLPRRFRRTHTL